MQWFKIKELSAGKKRLLFSFYLYKIFGKNILYFIAFFVAFATFIFSKSTRNYSKKYFTAVKDFVNIKPTLFNQFRHIFSYANSLVDKMLFYVGDFDVNNICFENEADKKQLFEDINKKNGFLLIFNHIGNIEVLKTFFLSETTRPNFGITVFLSNRQSKVFNEFLNKIEIDFPVKIFPIEEIGLTTGIELEERLKSGDAVMIAGDRLSENNSEKRVSATLYGYKILLPKGTFKIAKLMNIPTYFITAIKNKNKYVIYLEKTKTDNERELADNFAKNLGEMVKIAPYQFYNFYDFFAGKII